MLKSSVGFSDSEPVSLLTSSFVPSDSSVVFFAISKLLSFVFYNRMKSLNDFFHFLFKVKTIKVPCPDDERDNSHYDNLPTSVSNLNSKTHFQVLPIEVSSNLNTIYISLLTLLKCTFSCLNSVQYDKQTNSNSNFAHFLPPLLLWRFFKNWISFQVRVYYTDGLEWYIGF